MALSDLLQGCSNRSNTVMISQECYKMGDTRFSNNIVISWLYRSDNINVTLLTSCSILVDNLGQAVRTGTTCWRLLARLATRCRVVVSMFAVHDHLCHDIVTNEDLRRISSPRTKLLATRCECLHLIKMNCLALWLDESAHASLAARCEELRARTGNPPLRLPLQMSPTLWVFSRQAYKKGLYPGSKTQ